jgi:hypothetical protein
MLKASIVAIIVFAISTGVSGAIFWVKPHWHAAPATAVSMPSIEELHAKAQMKGLPEQTVKEPF